MNLSKKAVVLFTATTLFTANSISLIPFSLAELPVFTANAADIVKSGECGIQDGTLTWTLDSNGTLIISGMGEMKDWGEYNSPWGFNDDIKKVIIEEGVTSIGYAAFYHCTSLASITIPQSVTDISMEAFENTPWLEKQNELSKFVAVNGILIDGRSCQGNVAVPDGIRSIGEGAFFWCDTIKSVKIPVGVTKICNSAFNQCLNLTSVTLSESVASVGKEAFYKCGYLSEITIKNADCVIFDAARTISDTATIYGYSDSTAEAYAEKYNREFISLGEKPVTTTATTTQPTTTTTTSPTTTEPYFILGDISGDSIIDSSDASLVLAEYAQIQTGGTGDFTVSQKSAADVNKDGIVDSIDASKILSYYAMISTGKEPTWG